MPHPKRIIPVSDVKPGDSFRFADEWWTHFAVERPWPNAQVVIQSLDEYGDEHANEADDALVTVGYTNRKAKRQRGKMARRARLAAMNRARPSTATKAQALTDSLRAMGDATRTVAGAMRGLGDGIQEFATAAAKVHT